MRTLRVSFAALGVALLLAIPHAALAQTAAEGYYDFLMARHLEASGDSKGAQALLEKAVAADPRSAEVRAELSAFHLRRDAADDAERVAKEALQLDDDNSEAHRVLGMLYAARSEDTGRGQAAQAAAGTRMGRRLPSGRQRRSPNNAVLTRSSATPRSAMGGCSIGCEPVTTSDWPRSWSALWPRSDQGIACCEHPCWVAWLGHSEMSGAWSGGQG